MQNAHNQYYVNIKQATISCKIWTLSFTFSPLAAIPDLIGITGEPQLPTQPMRNQRRSQHTNKEILQATFGELEFKEGNTSNHTFKKMFVRIRDEIITFKQDVALENKAPYIEPEELNELLEKGEVIMFDARNDYESKIGKFKGAIAPDIGIFSDFPDFLV